ncbi:MAG: InlB B-repeat-containing protein [Treponematales bacterium]
MKDFLTRIAGLRAGITGGLMGGMKTALAFLCAFALAFGFTACPSGDDDTPTYTVTFNSNGGTAVEAQTVTEGGTATAPAAPTKAAGAGFYVGTPAASTLAGWYKEAALTTQWDFDTDTVTADITLYAKWTGGAIDTTTQTGTTVIDKAVAWLTANAAADTLYTLVLGENIPAQGTVTLNDAAFHDASGVTLTLTTIDAATRSVTIDSTGGSLFRLEGRKPKTLVLDGAVKLIGKENNTDSLVSVGGGAALELKGSAQITGNLVPHGGRGAGVYVESGGTLTMSGGSVISGNSANEGGGVLCTGEFTMESGGISGNTSTNGGGGVSIMVNGRFTMNGGSISGNTAHDGENDGTGGGIQMEGNAVTIINGGTISGNRAGGTGDDGGGGIMLYEGTLTINGGEIRGNTSATRGGGISIAAVYGNGADLVLSGGTVYGSNSGDASNTAGTFGASLYVASGTAKYGGGADIPFDEDGGRAASATLTGR